MSSDVLISNEHESKSLGVFLLIFLSLFSDIVTGEYE